MLKELVNFFLVKNKVALRREENSQSKIMEEPMYTSLPHPKVTRDNKTLLSKYLSSLIVPIYVRWLKFIQLNSSFIDIPNSFTVL